MSGGQVLSSIIGFGLVYALLFVIWLRVLHDKIRKGPDLPGSAQHETDELKGFLEVAAERPTRPATMIEAEKLAPAVEGETPP